MPLNEDGSFKEVNIYGKKYKGKALYDILEHYSRKGYYSLDPIEKEKGRDIMWFIWKNKDSPVFGKEKMTTFERYFILDKKTHEEPKNPYYKLYEKEEVVNRILEEFGLPAKGSHIINGHVPVAVKKRRVSGQMQRQVACYRRWIFQSISAKKPVLRVIR